MSKSYDDDNWIHYENHEPVELLDPRFDEVSPEEEDMLTQHQEGFIGLIEEERDYYD
ncbi:MAG: hypothetical protein QQN63_00740 [Nitrosopumilus sp.]